MKRIMMSLFLIIVSASSVLADYTGTYGKVDNMEIGIDLFIDFLVFIAPFMFFIFLALLIVWGYRKLTN